MKGLIEPPWWGRRASPCLCLMAEEMELLRFDNLLRSPGPSSDQSSEEAGVVPPCAAPPSPQGQGFLWSQSPLRRW